MNEDVRAQNIGMVGGTRRGLELQRRMIRGGLMTRGEDQLRTGATLWLVGFRRDPTRKWEQ